MAGEVANERLGKHNSVNTDVSRSVLHPVRKYSANEHFVRFVNSGDGSGNGFNNGFSLGFGI